MTGKEFTRRLTEEKLLLPPLAGYTDFPYRRILAEFDAPFICTEMVSCEAVVRGNPRTQRMLLMPTGDHLNGAQLFGEDPTIMAAAAEIIEYLGFDYIDINMGCAVKAVTQNGAGVSLMGEPEKAALVVRSVVEAVTVPVTCKMRLGESRGELNAVELSPMLEDAGVSAITVHGRSGEKKFGEKVDLKAIRMVAETVDVPVVGNGGVYGGADAVVMMESAGVDAVMPGRGLIGNPWIITEIRSAYSGVSYAEPSLEEKKTTCRKHLEYLIEHCGEKDGVLTMRRVLPRYFMGAVHASDLRTLMTSISSFDEMINILERIEDVNGSIFFQRE